MKVHSNHHALGPLFVLMLNVCTGYTQAQSMHTESYTLGRWAVTWTPRSPAEPSSVPLLIRQRFTGASTEMFYFSYALKFHFEEKLWKAPTLPRAPAGRVIKIYGRDWKCFSSPISISRAIRPDSGWYWAPTCTEIYWLEVLVRG